MLLHVAMSLSCLCFSPWFQRKICGPDGGDMVSVVKSLTERVSMVFVYSHSSEHCQTILNSLESLGNLHITAS
ncbi:hypothetical protein GBAR_LOCUS19395 [Geodia barretti]|uniref:Uncharacterized protein n=1 Tax=Geodia barretti TaxID=519541 RepID=A0AA35WVL4_GEOBA|nr:hypothetical protein GBAR_LOCUS19395 [Geodia barretti]